MRWHSLTVYIIPDTSKVLLNDIFLSFILCYVKEIPQGSLIQLSVLKVDFELSAISCGYTKLTQPVKKKGYKSHSLVMENPLVGC